MARASEGSYATNAGALNGRLQVARRDFSL